MPAYSYKATDSEGRIVKGTLTAGDETAVSTRLDEMGYTPISITLSKGGGPSKFSGDMNISFGPPKVKAMHLIAFTRQFATIIKAGVPIVQGLGILAQQTESDGLKRVLKEAIVDIESGTNLSDAIKKHPSVFSEIYINTIAAGESGGVLESVLLKLSDMLERDNETRQNVKQAMQYPILTLVALGVAMFVLVTFVVPKFSSMYARFESDLPLPTQVLIWANFAITNYWFIVLPAMVGAFFAIRFYAKTKIGTWHFDSLSLKIPVFGQLFQKVAMSRFSMMLMTLNHAGLPILQSFDIVSRTVGNVVVGKEVSKIRQAVADGRGISDTVLKCKTFPPLVGHMISIGEKTGELDEMLHSVAEYYDLEIKSMIKNLTTLIEPLMTAVLGTVVLGMALAIFLPMWNMIKLFRGGHG
ncbi:MAG: type II secretion system F family protein [Candidatus Omnitrophica bacterium]|nr:type II secretion system F family protein [Candidatus Omnitrophota bacterium]